MEIGPKEVSEAITRDAASFRLVDVRGPDEYETARIEGATLLTRELADEMVDSWEKDTPIVFYCHHGVRSLQAAHFFAHKGFTNVKSMSGGIDAWSLEVDPSVPRY